MYDLDEFLQGALMNEPIILVSGGIGGIGDPKKTKTCVNEIRGKGKTFTCWSIEDGSLVLYLDD